ncbi:MAG: transporter substrate-binding domain-containing protein, partial [Deltaproteobacteria bacterium]|nr:transporter substrate-binding domain-containing protein [Deltaproteobacteria bacterium]
MRSLARSLLAPALLLGVAACRPAPSPPPPPPPPPPDPEIVEVKAEGAPVRELPIDTGDLDAVLKRGALRVLVYGTEESVLPRDGASSSGDRDVAVELARQLGVRFEPIAVARFGELIPMLLEGKGDLIAARLAQTKERQKSIAFTRPTTTVSELLIGKKGDATAPKKVAELKDKTVTVRRSSSYRETLDALAQKEAVGVVV